MLCSSSEAFLMKKRRDGAKALFLSNSDIDFDPVSSSVMGARGSAAHITWGVSACGVALAPAVRG